MSNHNNSIDESQQAEQAKLSEQPQPSEQQAQSAEQPQLSGQTGVIYKITCLVNGKGYVGKTRQKLNDRIRQHKNDGKHGRPGIDAAIEKYKLENFTVEVLEECTVELLSDREIFFIAALETKAPNGYNLTDGGDGNPNPSPEICAKISANHADVRGEKNPNYGKKTPPEVCAKISASNRGKPSPQKGKKRSPETCAKISAACMGRPSPRKGKKHTPESIAKMSAAKKGKKGTPHTPESKAKIAAALTGRPSPQKGKPRSPETKAKIAAALKAAWAKKKLESQNNS